MGDPHITIRPETLDDYAAIANVHLRAFGNGYGEGQIVAFHRQRPGYEPRLSLVAERNGEVVGHVLYSPRLHRILGEDVRGLNLSPLGVLPEHQNSGVGGALMEAGDAAVKSLGYAFVTILGHQDYYPRFGYHGNAYGWSGMTIAAGALHEGLPLDVRKVKPDDAASLRRLWRSEEDSVDMAVVPDNTALAWFSPDPRVQCHVYLDRGEIVGYTRTAAHEPGKVRLFLAADDAVALRMASQLAQGGALALPLHPASRSAGAFAEFGRPDCSASPYCLGKTFAPCPFDEYFDLLKRGERTSGRIIWPAEFDV